MKTLKTRKGFTLIEIVTVIVVLGILGAFSLTFIDNATKTYMLAKKQGNLSREATYIMERITRELRDAKDVNNSSPADYLYFFKQHGTLMDSSKPYIWIYLTGDTANSLNRFSFSLTPFEWTIIRLGRSVTQFNITRNNQGTVNESVSILLTLTDGDQSVSISTGVSPKNFLGPGGNPSYSDRCFNGDYEDVIQ